MRVYEIPEGSRQARGLPLVNLLPLDREAITAIIPVRDFGKGYLFMATAQGLVKRTALSEFAASRREGLIAVLLGQQDTLVGVEVTGGDDELMLVSAAGLLIRFREKEVRSVGRLARGVKGMEVAADDRVVALVRPADAQDLLVVTEQGFGKRTALDAYRRQSRGGRGILTLRSDLRRGRVVAAKAVKEEDEILLISTEGEVIRLAVREIPRQGRTSQGVTLMRLAEGEKIAALALA